MPPITAVPIAIRLLAPARSRGQGASRRNEGEAGHQDRPQPDLGRFDRGVDDPRALAFRTLGEFDHQDRILGRRPMVVIRPTWRINVVLQPAQRHEKMDPTRPNGMTSKTATGIDQLS